MKVNSSVSTIATPGTHLGDNQLATDDILTDFYRPSTPTTRLPPTTSTKAGKSKPTHYKIVCISLYNEDIERLSELVDELKRRGHTKANKSQVIRAALDQIDLAKIPKGY